ncbi:MAG: hypothetical protein GF335_04455 [Candidatus Moranbacteria bacterium]|nr:hypothetical protein [Candidatus Moranbacteria bacterium]
MSEFLFLIIGSLIPLIYVGFFIFSVIALIFLIFKRIKDKAKEDFEKRDY